MAVLLLGACSSGASSASISSSPTESPSPSPSPTQAPTTFRSLTYGYSLTLPGGWTSEQASTHWDGKGAPGHEEPEVDKFIGTGPAGAWAMTARTTKDLAAYVQALIAANAAVHSATCPSKPTSQEQVDIGGQAGTLLAYDCGILTNTAVTVRNGIGYVFGMRDPTIPGATDPADRAVFLAILKSVIFEP
jgi:hypothetical protein